MRDIDVYGYIGKDFWDEDSVSAKQFMDSLRECGGEDVTVHINSGGGDVFEAQAMCEAIRAYPGRVTASVEGLAASSASFFALTADEVVMNPCALLMVHNPYTVAMGDAAHMRETADLLDKVRGTIVSRYVSKTGAGQADVEAWMDAETWMSADEALERGFVDRLSDDMPVAACVSASVLSRFAHAPESLVAAAGERGRSIDADENADDAVPGAGPAGEGASPRAVCVTGTFLNA